MKSEPFKRLNALLAMATASAATFTLHDSMAAYRGYYSRGKGEGVSNRKKNYSTMAIKRKATKKANVRARNTKRK